MPDTTPNPRSGQLPRGGLHDPAPSPVEHFLRFTPVPVKARRDGWSAELQLRFVLHLARGAGVDEAARLLGRSRQSAYALRERAGAEGFASAWDMAVDFAREARGAASARARAAVSSTVETLLVPRYYRGRLIGYVQRDDLTGLMARLGRLDRLAARLELVGAGERLRAASERLGPLPGRN